MFHSARHGSTINAALWRKSIVSNDTASLKKSLSCVNIGKTFSISSVLPVFVTDGV